MKKYAQLENGIVVLVIDSEEDPDGINGAWVELSAGAGIGWSYDGIDFFPPEPVVVPKIITKLEYMNRFTDSELINIYTSAKTVVQLEIWLEKFKLATEINLNDPLIKAGLDSLVALGLLAENRIADILK